MVTYKIIILFLLYFNLNYANQCINNCDCWNPNKLSLTINCSKRNITKLPSTFPDNPQHLIISYAYNPLITLTKLPPTTSSVSISFKNCSLKDLVNNIFIDVSNIKFVDLSYNQLHYENLVPEVFQGKFNEDDYESIGLQELNLAHNKISSLDIKLFEHCSHLTILDLSGNPLHILDEGTWFAINTLHLLKHLNLSNTHISLLPERQIFNDRLQLVVLDLSNNYFTTVPEVLGTMSESLEILSLSNNPIEEFNDQSFIGLENLKELFVNNMENLHTIKHNTFSNLKNLKTLHLDHNPNLMYINENAFGISENWPPIIEFYINDDNLKELSPTLLNWTKITVARFEGNNWNCECKTLPCSCIGVDLAYRNLPTNDQINDSSTPGIRRPYLLIIPIILGFIAIVFSWRVLKKYRNRRLVNAMYPIMYTATPVNVP